MEEIEAHGWSLNPGRYVGVADREDDDFVFAERLEELNEELEVLNNEASELEERIKGISNVQLLTPPEARRKAFHGSVLPLFELQFCLEKKNSNLRTTRDLPLPKLVSGQLDVEDLDIDLGAGLIEQEEAVV